jgi:hypothetical protein
MSVTIDATATRGLRKLESPLARSLDVLRRECEKLWGGIILRMKWTVKLVAEVVSSNRIEHEIAIKKTISAVFATQNAGLSAL